MTEADRAAAESGMPGVAVNEAGTATPTAQEAGEELRSKDKSGDRAASRQDTDRLRSRRS
jgi:hypothetical protein